MNATQFADKYLYPYKIRGNEIIPRLCPYCHGGQHSHDKESFALNTDKLTFNCRRGSCGVTGSFYQLCKDFNEESDWMKDDNYEYKKQPKRVYKKPVTNVITPTDKVDDYLKLRGFSKETCINRKIGSDEKGNIVMPYYENGKLVLIKFRPSHKIVKKNGDIKSWREEGGKPVFWGMDECNPELPLVIVEGECFPGDAEILTPRGWVSFQNYRGDEVLQVYKDLSSSFTMPTQRIKKQFKGDLLRVERGGNYVSMTTPNHNLVYFKDNGEIVKRKACEMPKSIYGNIPTTVHLNGAGILLTNDQIALCIAVSADACIDIRKGTGRIKPRENRYARFGFKKKRKVQRLTELIDRLGLKCSNHLIKNNYTSICFPIPKWCSGRLLTNSWIGLATEEQRQFILDEMVLWDGNRVNGRNQTEYSSKYYHNAVFMQTIAHTSGKMSTIMRRSNDFGKWYKVSILNSKSSVSWQNITPKKIPYDDIVYCVTVPTGMILVRQDGHITVSGNCDALALDEAGIKNVVSVPSGSEDLTCIELCWNWLETFKKIIIWGDNDEPGQEMVRKLINRLGEYRCSLVNSDRKDANEVLYHDGKNKIIDAISNAKEVPIAGLLRLSDVENFDYSKVERVSSGFELIDKAIGGFMMGQVSLWTGSNASGKSTLLGQILVESIDKGFNVCAFSGELPAPLFKYWIELQMAGKLNLNARYDELKKEDIYFVPDNIKDKMKAWYRDKFFLYDSFGSAKGEDILKIFEYAARRYDCKVFSIDNLMITDFCSANKDFYRAQSEFMGKIIEFTHKFNVHVHVVAHPRKTSGDITKNDVGGSGDLTNRVDNVFSVSRIDQDDPKISLALMDCDNKVDILKNRFSGKQDITIGLKFEPLSKRFYAKSDINSDSKRYGWNDQQTLITEVQIKSPWDGDEE